MTTTTDRATDARVAEMVMGATWTHEPDAPGGDVDYLVVSNGEGGIMAERRCSDGRVTYFAGLAAYTTDPAADLSVLEHVRTTWDHERRWAFARVLVEVIWRERGATRLPPAMRYEVGDYSRAALAVIDGRTW